MKGLLGKKIGMTQIFREDGDCIPVTVLEMGPVVAVQVKTPQKDGYNAVQVGYQKLSKTKNVNRPTKGHFKNISPTRYLKEFAVVDASKLQPGQQWDVRIFSTGEQVRVSGTSKGRGFQGVIKRHGFSGGPASHGSQFHRTPGSIGCHTDPGRVFKGKAMPGHMGHQRVSVHNLRVEKVDIEKNLLLIRGAVPGPNGGLVEVTKYTLEDIPPVTTSTSLDIQPSPESSKSITPPVVAELKKQSEGINEDADKDTNKDTNKDIAENTLKANPDTSPEALPKKS